MNRIRYFNYISDKINSFAYNIESHGKNNLMDYHVHAENFYAGLFNVIFDMNLINLNNIDQNVAGIDLIDEDNKIIIQVSATCDAKKIQSSLSKDIYDKYQGYHYMFISISKKTSPNLKKKHFNIPNDIEFDSQKDIWDIDSILKEIMNLDVGKLLRVYQFVKKELGEEVSDKDVPSNLTKVINRLAEENLNIENSIPEVKSFKISDKIEFNDLMREEACINDYKIYGPMLEELYRQFDEQSQNVSFTILQKICKIYRKLKNEGNKTSVEIFFEIREHMKDIVLNSSNYQELSLEELDLCVDIIAVDTFIRCKIFENPGGYSDAVTR